MRAVDLGTMASLDPANFFTEEAEDTECRGSPSPETEITNLQSARLFCFRFCITRSQYPPFPLYPPFRFAGRKFHLQCE